MRFPTSHPQNMEDLRALMRGRERTDMGSSWRSDRHQACGKPYALHCASNDVSPASSRTVEREKSNVSVLATSAHTSTDCISSTALMVYRGIGAGIAWTIAVDLYALVGATDSAWQEHLAGLPRPSTKAREFSRLLLASCGRNVLGFGGFLMVFGGLTCSLEMVRGRHDMVNPFIGGFASGLVILPRELFKTPKYLVGGAALCGSVAMAMHHFFPASSEGRRDHEVVRRDSVATVHGEMERS
jgi:hypothetical protein